jgi:WD40 repeat protein
VLAAAGLAQEGVCLWHIAEQRCKTRLPVRDGQVRALAVHTGSGRLALGTSLGQLAIWDLATALPDHVAQLPAVQIRSLEFTRDGQQLLSSGSDGVAQLWDARSGEVLQRFSAASPVQDALLDVEHARVLLGTRSGEIELWSSTGTKLGAQKAHADWTMDLALHAGSAQLASAGGNGEIVFWSLGPAGSSTLERLGSAQAHEGRALSVDASPDGELFASGGEDGVVLLWGAQRRERVARLVHHRGAVRSVRFSGDGKVLSSGGDDGSVRLWDLQRLKESGESLLASAERRSGVTLEGVKLELAAEPVARP